MLNFQNFWLISLSYKIVFGGVNNEPFIFYFHIKFIVQILDLQRIKQITFDQITFCFHKFYQFLPPVPIILGHHVQFQKHNMLF